MDFVAIAEVISSYAAIITVGLAGTELLSRSKAKRADATEELYADHLHLCQQLNYSVQDVDRITREYQERPPHEIAIFANSHRIQPELFHLVTSLEKECICTMDCAHRKNKELSALILNFSGRASNLLTTVNNFYNLLSSPIPPEKELVQEYRDNIFRAFDELVPLSIQTGSQIRDKLRQVRKFSNRYLFLLFGATALFLAVCYLLGQIPTVN